MNEQERIQQWKDYNKLQARLENRFLPVIKKVLSNQISSFTDRFLSTGIQDYNRIKGTEMTLVIATMHVYSAIVNGTRVYKNLKQTKAGNMGYNERWTKEVLKYFEDHNLRLVKNITDNTKERIKQLLKEGVEKGYGADKLARMLKNDGFTKFRALRIVRTETVRATNYANFLAAGELGIEQEKQWIAVHDSRTRDSHKYLDGEVKEMEEEFENGCLYPGDPLAEAKETINCRCTLGFVAKRDRLGNLINVPEQQPPLIEYEEQESIADMLIRIMQGAVLGFLVTDILGISDQIKTFVTQVFKGIGLASVISNFFDK